MPFFLFFCHFSFCRFLSVFFFLSTIFTFLLPFFPPAVCFLLGHSFSYFFFRNQSWGVPVVVRDTQPSTIIAFALASDTYNNQLVEIQRRTLATQNAEPATLVPQRPQQHTQQPQQHVLASHPPPAVTVQPPATPQMSFPPRSQSSSSLSGDVGPPTPQLRSPRRKVEVAEVEVAD